MVSGKEEGEHLAAIRSTCSDQRAAPPGLSEGDAEGVELVVAEGEDSKGGMKKRWLLPSHTVLTPSLAVAGGCECGSDEKGRQHG